MEKNRVKINENLINSILAQDVYNDMGNLVVCENTLVNPHILKKLYEFKIDNVLVYDSELIIDSFENAEFKKEYKKDVEIMKSIIQDIAAGKNVDYKKVETVSHDIYSKVNNSLSLVECIKAVKDVDSYTYSHSVNVSIYAMLLGKWLKFKEDELMDIITAGLLHDVGKAKIPLEILNKKGRLTDEEFEVMKKHPVLGYNIVKDLKEVPREVKQAVLMHHEKENGKGYPLGIKGNQKNHYSKIITIADIFDAITSDRVYKERQTPFDAFRELEKIGYDVVDPKIMLVFFANLPNYYIGSKVKMDTGEIGEVVYIPPQCIYTPIVRINDDFLDIAKETTKVMKKFI
jgi:putative nucleotidyltransferase with HDIG domain